MDKKKNHNKTFKKLKCSPKLTTSTNKLHDYSCYNNLTIFELKEQWNLINKKKIVSNDPLEIWLFLKKKFINSCKNELCWLNKLNMDNHKITLKKKKFFRPKSPITWKKNAFTWLSSDDIIKVMNQYESIFSNFKFIGPTPIDFDYKIDANRCVWEELCRFNLQNFYNNKITKIGIIFNLDKHYQRGSHWTCLFIDIDLKYIFYFDSNGKKNLPKEVNMLINKIISQGKRINIDFKLIINNKEHQKLDGQCGVYSMYIIIMLLRERYEPTYFLENRISDKLMKKYRKIYYN